MGNKQKKKQSAPQGANQEPFEQQQAQLESQPPRHSKQPSDFTFGQVNNTAFGKPDKQSQFTFAASESIQEEEILEKRDTVFMDEYCKPQPVLLSIKGLGLKTDDWNDFTKKLQMKFDQQDEDEGFDWFELRDFKGIKATQFNYILEIVKQRLAGRDLIGFSMQGCRFSTPQSVQDHINADLLLGLCSKAYHFSVVNCRLGKHLPLMRSCVTTLVQTTASLSELSIKSVDILEPETLKTFFECAQGNAQITKLTVMHLFDMEGLQDEAELVDSLVSLLSKMEQLEDLGLENCMLFGEEIREIAIAMQQAPFLPKLKRVNLSANEFNSKESLLETVKMVAHAPKFEQFECRRTGLAITANHEVKVRKTDKDNHVIDTKPFIKMQRVWS